MATPDEGKTKRVKRKKSSTEWVSDVVEGSGAPSEAKPKRPKAEASQKASGKADDKPKKKATEKRVDKNGNTVRYKGHATVKDRERIERAMPGSGHRLYLIDRKDVAPVGADGGAVSEFAILGATGNVYTVSICRFLNCTCPDHAKGNVCKHILFVMLRVLKLDPDNHIVWQRALLEAEANEALSSKAGADTSTMANAAARKAYLKATGAAGVEADTAEGGDNDKPVEGECPICFDVLEGEPTVACGTCKNHMHKKCMDNWLTMKRQRHEEPQCVLCRSAWTATGGEAEAVHMGQYLNLADASGMPAPSLGELYNPLTLRYMGTRRSR